MSGYELKPGDIVSADADGNVHVRRPTKWEEFRWKYVYPVTTVVFFPVRLAMEIYWGAYHHARRHEPRCSHGHYMADACGICERLKK